MTGMAATASPRLLGAGTAGLAMRIGLVVLAVLGALNSWFRVVPRLTRELHELEGR